MADGNERVRCPEHGEAYPAYVCRHLIERPEQKWCCDYPSRETPWPDAWCRRCDAEFLKEGEWNERNEGKTEIRLICHRCYEQKKGSSAAALMERVADAWATLVEQANAEVEDKQERLRREFDMSKHERWDLHQDTRQLVFSTDGVAAVIADFQFVGSLSSLSNTWLWSWANTSMDPSTYADLIEVRRFGEAEGFSVLTVPKWPAAEVDGWEMAAVAAKITGAEGIYRAPGANGFSFLLLTSVRRTQ